MKIEVLNLQVLSTLRPGGLGRGTHLSKAKSKVSDSSGSKYSTLIKLTLGTVKLCCMLGSCVFFVSYWDMEKKNKGGHT